VEVNAQQYLEVGLPLFVILLECFVKGAEPGVHDMVIGRAESRVFKRALEMMGSFVLYKSNLPSKSFPSYTLISVDFC